jgi:membrane protease YdiL (CAAX protease family)
MASMTTLIGRHLQASPYQLIMLSSICLASLTIDIFLNWQYGRASDAYQPVLNVYEQTMTAYVAREVPSQTAITAYNRAYSSWLTVDETYQAALCGGYVIGFFLLAFFGVMAKGRRSSFGLTMPVQGWTYWVWLGTALFLFFAILVVVLPITWWLLGWRMDGFLSLAADTDFVEGGLRSPVLEEILYRFALCTVVAARWGPCAAIVLSGSMFGFAHIIYGNPNVFNLAGGFFLAWSFLKSNSILVPILFHALGNLYLFLVIQLLFPFFC